MLALAPGCSALRQTAAPPPGFYSLDDAHLEARSPSASPATFSIDKPTLIVNPPHAASGFDSQRIIYVREPHKLEYFARSEWVDTPARMLAPLIVSAVETRGGAFRAVLLTPSAATGDLRLDTEITRLQHDFTSQPSRVRFTLRANLVDNRSRRVLALHEFDETVAAASETPYGGVIAANLAVQTVLEQLARFCADAAANWHRSGAEAPKATEDGATFSPTGANSRIDTR
ncbi:MAG TPA: ABC-type transport auxiliary lipoprotein family protein [Aromatoleum sp.]|uniref:ABC-type transport auxiliary lipoprotein family protein n=1 Tax=Aromatoleum sp. TaxID=2307007 RepID=UPI002B47765F|nr:ABC-type transport auxiliary lipoprotein family protein [Aromatoleum sp.]HJV27915.1 ABC-type transport auxiliary lipoprotein family protein [Aromatoleum sp.]